MGLTWPLERRESGFAAATLLLAASLFARGWMEEQRPSGEASFQAGQPSPNTPIVIGGMDRSGSQGVVAHARALRLTSFGAKSGQVPGGIVELAIPVSPATCNRLQRAAGMRCGGVNPVTTPVGTLDWGRVTSLRIELTGARSVTANSVGSTLGSALRTWTITPLATRVRVEFPCLKPAQFSLYLPQATTTGRCQAGRVWMRWALNVPRRQIPSLFLDGTRALKLTMTGSRVGSNAEAGIVSAVDTTHEVDHAREPIAFRSDSADLAVELDMGTADERMQVHAPKASSVRLGGQLVLPSIFTQKKEGWLAGMGTLFGIWLGALWSLVVSWPRRKSG